MTLNTTTTILLVEDESSDVFIMKRALRNAQIPHTLQVACDGQVAISYLAGIDKYSDRTQFPMPNIIFLDLKLPYKSGFEVLAWIRGQSIPTPVAVLTSSSEERDIRECRTLGARTFLVKPPTPAMLSEVVANVTLDPNK